MDLTRILKKATAGIEERYFQLKIDGGPAVYRERVYCYELYHQLRVDWTRTDYVVNGEVDKSGHPIMERLGAKARKPDLLIHGPGDMDANYAIIEVKPCNANDRGIKKDLETLSFFRGQGRYQRAIFLLYGLDARTAAKRLIGISKRRSELNQIELWIHEKPNMPALHLAIVGEGDVKYSAIS
jgi:hypothetical protein